jgi:lysophospholipase L1-like esterase
MMTNAPVNLDILLIGDSLASQWPISLLSPLEVANYGVGGDKPQNVLGRLTSLEFLKLKPKNVLILIGTNSLPSDKPCVIIAGLKQVVARVSMMWPPARIFVLEVPPRGQDLKFKNDVRLEVNLAIRDIQSIKAIAVDDEITCAWKTPCENYNADGVHLTPAGYEILTKLLRNALSQ